MEVNFVLFEWRNIGEEISYDNTMIIFMVQLISVGGGIRNKTSNDNENHNS